MWGPPPGTVACLCASPVTTTSLSLNLPIGSILGISSKLAPSVFGVHLSIGHMPLGT